MNDIFSGTGNMLVMAVAVFLIVLAAMGIDLASGLYKAKQRHEIRSSWGLKRTLTKFITYEGGVMIALGVDLLMHFCHFWVLIRLDLLSGVPVITCLVGIFLLIVEGLSIHEKADEKTKTELSRAGKMVETVVKKDELIDIMTEAIRLAIVKNGQKATVEDG